MTRIGSGPHLPVNEVHVTADRLGRTIIVIPDGVAAALREAVAADWSEARSMAFGQSILFPSWTWVYETTSTLMMVYARTEPTDPTRIDAYVVGESAWDEAAGWWAGYDQYQHLVVPGKAHVRFGCYRWEG